MKWWLKFGCFLTGWNSQILSQCSEASFKHLKKYTSALLILIILWGFTGYCFAQRYVGAPWWGCALSSLVFITIVIQIERQIILTIGHNWWAFGFRLFIACIMAVLGSAIIDQIIFGKDIERKMVEITDKQVQEQLPQRLNIINDELYKLQNEIDSLDKSNTRLKEEIAKNPTITTVGTSTTVKKVVDANGEVRSVPETTITRTPIANPRISQTKTNDKTLERLRSKQDKYEQDRLNAEQDLRKTLSQNVGFLEELRAMIEILSTRTEALVFYLTVFLFLISLELFIVASKFGDKTCDYDLIVLHQLHIKEEALNDLIKKNSSQIKSIQ